MKKTTLYVAGGIVALIFAVAIGLWVNRPSAQPSSSIGYAGIGLAVAPSAAPMPEKSAFISSDIAYPVPPPTTAGATAAEVQQRIIKNGTLDMVVGDVGDVAAKLSGMATRRKGFVQSSSVSERADGTHAGNMSIRVPSDQFEAAMIEAKTYASLVKYEASTGQDVTEQYTDLQARLHNAQAQEQVYLQVLTQARTVEDILKVQDYLGRIRQEIESLQGQIKYLENVTGYSTITISLEEESTVHAPTKSFRPLDAAKAAIQALVAAAQSIVIALIWIAIVGGGILVPLGLIVWLIVRLVRRRMARP